MSKPEIRKEADDWEDVEPSGFYKFENVGDKVEGELLEKSMSEDKKFGMYTLKGADGENIRIHGSTHLDDLMLQINVGDHVKIEFVDTQKRPKGTMKLFSIKRRK